MESDKLGDLAKVGGMCAVLLVGLGKVAHMNPNAFKSFFKNSRAASTSTMRGVSRVKPIPVPSLNNAGRTASKEKSHSGFTVPVNGVDNLVLRGFDKKNKRSRDDQDDDASYRTRYYNFQD